MFIYSCSDITFDVLRTAPVNAFNMTLQHRSHRLPGAAHVRLRVLRSNLALSCFKHTFFLGISNTSLFEGAFLFPKDLYTFLLPNSNILTIIIFKVLFKINIPNKTMHACEFQLRYLLPKCFSKLLKCV